MDIGPKGPDASLANTVAASNRVHVAREAAGEESARRATGTPSGVIIFGCLVGRVPFSADDQLVESKQ